MISWSQDNFTHNTNHFVGNNFVYSQPTERNAASLKLNLRTKTAMAHLLRSVMRVLLLLREFVVLRSEVIGPGVQCLEDISLKAESFFGG